MDDSNTTGLTRGTAQPFDSLKDTIEDLTNGLAKFEKSQNPIQVQANPSAVQQPTQQPANQQLRPPIRHYFLRTHSLFLDLHRLLPTRNLML